MTYKISDTEFKKVIAKAEHELLSSIKIKFDFNRNWSTNFPKKAGVYAIYENDTLLYIGETANLKERMMEVKRTYNHAFRKKLGENRFNGKILKRKFSDKVEQQLDAFFKTKVHMSYIVVNFGRLEIESSLIEKFQRQLLNSERRRK